MGPDGKLYFNIGAPRQHRDADLQRGVDHARRPEDRRARELAQRRAQLGRLRLAPEDQGALVHQPRRATGSGDDMPERHAAPRAEARAMQLRLSVLPPGRHARSRVRQEPLVRRVRPRPRSSSARTSRRSGMQLLHRQDVPGRVPATTSSSPMHGSWNRDDQAGLQRDARRARRQGQGQQARAVPRRLPAGREGRSADVGPAGRRAA